MDEREEQQSPENNVTNKNPKIPEYGLAELKRQSSLNVSSPRTQAGGRPRMNCLCSPTTHAGSFRCRYHRVAGMTRGGSVGSNLSMLAAKTGPISDSLQAQ